MPTIATQTESFPWRCFPVEEGSTYMITNSDTTTGWGVLLDEHGTLLFAGHVQDGKQTDCGARTTRFESSLSVLCNAQTKKGPRPVLHEYKHGKLVYVGSFSHKGKQTHLRQDPRGKEYDPDTGTLLYHGQFQGGIRKGNGTVFEAGKKQYEGGVFDRLWHGDGVEYDSAGRVVREGTWAHGRMSGHGKEYVYEEDGSAAVKEGIFVEGRLNGVCSFRQLATGSIYFFGSMMHGRAHGGGIQIHKDGTKYIKYDGSFVHHTREGHGRVHMALIQKGHAFTTVESIQEYSWQLMYEGEFKADVHHGNGTMWHFSTGKIKYVGQFHEGKFHGKGVQYDSEGIVEYEGTFQHGKRHGWGRTFEVGDRTQGKDGWWNHGIRDEEQTERERLKRKREEDLKEAITETYSQYGGDQRVPECLFCKSEMHHGDPSFAYLPCGHRVVCGACGDGDALGEWKCKCPLCKCSPASLVKIY